MNQGNNNNWNQNQYSNKGNNNNGFNHNNNNGNNWNANSDGWNGNQNGSDFNGKNQNKNQKNKEFSMLVGNYPPSISPDAILNALINLIREKYRKNPNVTKTNEFPSFDFQISVPSLEEQNAFLSLNGCFVFNNPIWIIKFPYVYDSISLQLSGIFRNATCNGIVDLSNLRQYFESHGFNSNLVDFGQRDFVEFLLFRLGSESRDRRFLINTLIVNGNNIQNINGWAPFFVFMPALHNVIAYNNPINVLPNIQNSNLTIECDMNRGDKKLQNQNKSHGWNNNNNNNWNNNNNDNENDDWNNNGGWSNNQKWNNNNNNNGNSAWNNNNNNGGGSWNNNNNNNGGGSWNNNNGNANWNGNNQQKKTVGRGNNNNTTGWR
ncbi:hypothetical protein TRFO_27543 [Tritrichomonas foetus]|uniref:Uncharacterized protein n=1 Tax=Tritrichomonas foetus TaxID=1144522 RepID=A0A1J4K5B4_9EUKA|nr:hypothetical protein TRFO_27543 [Tritrichomonas foetus]|eukprot:OHT04870.1 hypothetical protein TRFO_27543 [Tritrichomonas foetus]